MGGIAGIICAQPVAREGVGAIVEKMVASLIHRGIDGQYTAYTPYGCLGHARHATIDIRGGDQPFHHPDKPYILVFDGVLYNYQALRQKLADKGVAFVTRSDTEVLMMMYDYYDEDMFEYLEGMYAFALWNGEKQELLIARDPVGNKPLYYEMDENGIAFASELKAILQARQSRPAINEVALQNYLALQYIPSPMTMFEGIFKLPPGYRMRWRIKDQSLEVLPTWVADDDLSRDITQNRNLTLPDAMAEWDQKLRHSVHLQSAATDYPPGLLVTGGLGAATLAWLMRENSQETIKTFSVSCPDSRAYQAQHRQAEAISQAFKTQHFEITLEGTILDQLPRILWHLDDPIADPALLMWDVLATKAEEEHCKMVLTAAGAESLFGADSKFRRYGFYRQMASSPALLRMMAGLLVNPVAYLVGGWEASQLAQGLSGNADMMAIWQTCRNFPQAERRKLLTFKDTFPDRRLRVFSKGVFDPYVQLQWDDLHHWLPHNLLQGLDKMNMGHRVEARTPYLSPSLVSWTMGLPQSLKWRGAQSQYLLHAYAAEKLPKELLRYAAMQTSLPLDTWLYERLPQIQESLLNCALVHETGFFKIKYLEKLLGAYGRGSLKTPQPLWNLIVLMVWYDVFTRCNSRDELWRLQTLGKTSR